MRKHIPTEEGRQIWIYVVLFDYINFIDQEKWAYYLVYASHSFTLT